MRLATALHLCMYKHLSLYTKQADDSDQSQSTNNNYPLQLHNSIKIKVGQVVLELLIQATFLTTLIHNFKTAWHINSFDANLIYLNNLEDAFCILFFKNVLIILR